MRKAYYTLDLTEAILLKDRFIQHGIPAHVENKGATRIPHEGIASEVWVAEDVDGDDARSLIRDFVAERQDAGTGTNTPWRCPHCLEENPEGFDSCWNCSQSK